MTDEQVDPPALVASDSTDLAPPKPTVEVALCTLGEGNDLWAVRLGAAKEIVKPPLPTRVPRADASVRGLFLLRGRLVTLIDLGARLGLRSLVSGSSEDPWTMPSRRAILLAERPHDEPETAGRPTFASLHQTRHPGLTALGVDAILGVERIEVPGLGDRRERDSQEHAGRPPVALPFASPYVLALVATQYGPAFLLDEQRLAHVGREADRS